MKTILQIILGVLFFTSTVALSAQTAPDSLTSTNNEMMKDSMLNIIDLNITITKKNNETLSSELIPNYKVAKTRIHEIEVTYDEIMSDYKDLFHYIKRKPNSKVMLSSIRSFRPSIQYKMDKMGERADDFDNSIADEISIILNTNHITYPEKKGLIEDLTDMRMDVISYSDKLADYSKQRLMSYIQSFW